MNPDVKILHEKLQEVSTILANFADASTKKSVLTTEAITQLSTAIGETNEIVKKINNQNLDFEIRLKKIEERLDLASEDK